MHMHTLAVTRWLRRPLAVTAALVWGGGGGYLIFLGCDDLDHSVGVGLMQGIIHHDNRKLS